MLALNYKNFLMFQNVLLNINCINIFMPFGIYMMFLYDQTTENHSDDLKKIVSDTNEQA